LGWWHTHVDGVGLFYSAVDRETQATWRDHQSIGIVLNPSLSGDGFKVYRGPHSEELTRASDSNAIAGLRRRPHFGEHEAKKEQEADCHQHTPHHVIVSHRLSNLRSCTGVFLAGVATGVLFAIPVFLSAALWRYSPERVMRISPMPSTAVHTDSFAPQTPRALSGVDEPRSQDGNGEGGSATAPRVNEVVPPAGSRTEMRVRPLRE
jgi:hypothetical protein